jgi:hypothetical protein
VSDLVTAIDLAQQANEQRIAAEINVPKHKIDDTEALLILRQFAEWCRSRGVKWLPATPATCAAWMHFQAVNHIAPEIIAKAIEAIQIAHDQQGFANPIATAAVRAELGRILDIKAPRSWNRKIGEDLVFNSLPIEVRAVIKRHADLDSLTLRRLQNRVAELAKKGNCNVENAKEIS